MSTYPYQLPVRYEGRGYHRYRRGEGDVRLVQEELWCRNEPFVSSPLVCERCHFDDVVVDCLRTSSEPSATKISVWTTSCTVDGMTARGFSEPNLLEIRSSRSIWILIVPMFAVSGLNKMLFAVTMRTTTTLSHVARTKYLLQSLRYPCLLPKARAEAMNPWPLLTL